MICGLVVGKIYKYEFRLYLQNLSGICKMGITFAYELGLKSFLYEKSSTGGTPLNIFRILKNLTEKKLRGFLRSGGKKIHQISVFLIFVKSGQTMVKLIIQEY